MNKPAPSTEAPTSRLRRASSVRGAGTQPEARGAQRGAGGARRCPAGAGAAAPPPRRPQPRAARGEVFGIEVFGIAGLGQAQGLEQSCRSGRHSGGAASVRPGGVRAAGGAFHVLLSGEKRGKPVTTPVDWASKAKRKPCNRDASHPQQQPSSPNTEAQERAGGLSPAHTGGGPGGALPLACGGGGEGKVGSSCGSELF